MLILGAENEVVALDDRQQLGLVSPVTTTEAAGVGHVGIVASEALAGPRTCSTE